MQSKNEYMQCFCADKAMLLFFRKKLNKNALLSYEILYMSEKQSS